MATRAFPSAAQHSREAAFPELKLPRSLHATRDLSSARRIVDAAEQIFADRGLAGARMEAIARAARVNKALLYYYFHSKEELYRYVLEAMFAELQAGGDTRRLAALAPPARVRGIVDNYFEFVRQHPNYPRLVQREMMNRGPNLSWMVSEYYRPMHRRLARFIEEGMERGDFRSVDAPQMAISIVALMVFYFGAAPLLSKICRRDTLRPAEIARRRKAVMDILEHGLFLPGARKR